MRPRSLADRSAANFPASGETPARLLTGGVAARCVPVDKLAGVPEGDNHIREDRREGGRAHTLWLIQKASISSQSAGLYHRYLILQNDS